MKLVLFILLFINICFASKIKDVYILKDSNQINFENIVYNKEFKKTKLPIKRNTKHDNWIKVVIDKNKLETNKQYLLNVKSSFSMNKIEFNKLSHSKYLDKSIIFIDKELEKDIYFKVYQTNSLTFIDIEVIELNDYMLENSFYSKLYAFSYGIIFSAFLYYLAFYIFNRQKIFIYYSLTQIFLLLIVFYSTVESTTENGNMIYSIFLLMFYIFSILFSREFLNTREYSPLLDRVLIILIFLFIVDTFTQILSKHFPTTILLLSYIISASYIYNKTKFKPILFYILAWSIIIVSFNIVDFSLYYMKDLKEFINLENLLHVTAPLESLILAFALSYKVKLLEEENIKKEQLLIHQNKLASMGEMISNIAHQWRQPLTHLSYIFMNINSAFKHQKLDQEYIDSKTQEATEQLEYMSNTIDDFKDFYSPKKEKTKFSIQKAISNSLTIISSTLEENNINLTLDQTEYTIEGYESEFSQIVLNLLTNAKDALVLNNIKEPKIDIKIQQNTIAICDNGGGISDNIKEKIFDPYFTTKDKGSGIGLYMSKTIIENHFQGKLYHENINGGSCFVIKLD